MAEKIEFDLTVPKNDLDKALNQGIKKSSELEGTLSTALAVFGGNLITKGFETLVGGLEGIISTGKEAIDAAAAQEVAVNNLNNALARSGNFTKQASADLLEFASTIQKTTKFEDDAVIANTALLQSLTKLNTEGLKQGVTAAADFATILGIDLETATRLVAKAAEGNVEAFKRYNVEIKKGATDSETFANAITALNSKFGGAAASQLNTYNGSLQALKNSYADLLEPIGDIVVKNPIIISSFNEIKNIINGTNEEVTSLTPVFQDFIQNGIFAAIAGFKVFADALDGITVLSKGLINTFQVVGGALAFAIVDPIKATIDAIIFLGSKLPVIGEEFRALTNPLDSARDSIVAFTQEGLTDLKNSADTNVFRQLSDGADKFADSIINGAVTVKLANDAIKNSNNQRLLDEQIVSAEILAQRSQLQNDILLLEEQFRNQEKDAQAQRQIVGQEEGLAKREAELQALLDQKLRENDIVLQAELTKAAIIKDEGAKQLAAQKALAQKRLADKKAIDDSELAFEKAKNQALIQDKNSFFAAATSLQNAKSKELAAIGKAFAIQQATIQGYEAIQSSYRYGAFLGGPPLGATFAAVAAAATAANVARIAGVQFENGGIVGQGASAGPDNRVATIRDGEMILNGQDQKILFDAIKSGNLGGDIIIKIDEREIARAVRNQRQQGFAI